MRWCQSCVLPDTRPSLVIGGDGVCNACAASRIRAGIDWNARRRALEEIAESAKARSKGHDCLIPVSGGKDSTWQVVQALELGLRPLCVTWRPPARTPLGRRNLDNLISLGVDHIDYSINPDVERRFTLAAFERFGATGVPMHMAIFNIPLTVAVRFEIPLILWGENSAAEYGGTEDEARGHRLDNDWLRKFGVTHGTAAKDWIGDGLSAKDLAPYIGPDPDALESQGIDAIFLGHFLPWDVETSLEVAKAHGFEAADRPRTGYYNYADIDDDFISIHHWMKWYKFGFTRVFDNLALEIRRGRMSRGRAIDIIGETGDDTPLADIEKFCGFAGITQDRFFEIAARFRNRDVWTRDAESRWFIPDFLIPDWSWT